MPHISFVCSLFQLDVDVRMGRTYVISRPSFYAIPMTLGLVCTLFGLAFWFKALEYLKDATLRINPVYTLLGSFLWRMLLLADRNFL